MKHISRMAFGRPETAAPDTEKHDTDKWVLLATLTEAAEDYGLNHRTLGVLRALLSFFPDRVLPGDPGMAVVFPSNATLSKRLNGMPESTLRRHLAALVRAGIVSRQDSPNRKRFARRHGLAFGFDLSPLARASEALHHAAEAARQRREELAVLRDRLAYVQACLLREGRLPEDDPLRETARLILRRKASAEDLMELLEALEPLVETPVPTEKASATDSRNERHIQSTNKKILVSKEGKARSNDSVSLDDLLRHCKEYKTYFPETPPDWHGLMSTSSRLHPMLGIAPQIYQNALRVLGPQKAATVVLCMLEKIGRIRNPGGYLKSLINRAETGDLNLRGMLPVG